jgi:tungstate transport system permease protein
MELFGIIALSLKVSLAATLLAALAAVPLGFVIAIHEFPGKRPLVVALNTLFSLPTVLVGLFVYALISHSGPLGRLNLLYTPAAMVIGQWLLALPVITALTYSATKGVDERVRPTALTLGADGWQAGLMVLREGRFGLLAAVAAGFGRVISEVGSAVMIGGNIRGYTRVMTTAIALETAKGEFQTGIILGLVLLAAALAVNLFVHSFLQARP